MRLVHVSAAGGAKASGTVKAGATVVAIAWAGADAALRFPGLTTTLDAFPLAVLAALFHRLGQHEAAASIAGFAFNPMTAGVFPEITTAIAHLRDVLGDQTYQSLARKGETMSTAEMATYAYDQIDQAREELNAVSK